MRNLFIFIFSAMLAISSFADSSPTTPAETTLDKHVMAISEELRCLVCQNQTIADSHADLAVDLRNQVREQIQQGKSDKEIFDYMVERYGDFVLYRPPLHTTTWLLWFGPFMLLIGGLIFLGLKLRNPAKQEELSESEQLRSAELLRNDASSNSKEQK